MKKRVLSLLLAVMLTLSLGVSALADGALVLGADSEPAQTEGKWSYENGKWYWYTDGEKVLGQWIVDGGKVYYVNAAGVMCTGWFQVDDVWYYAGKDGARQTGWLYQGKKWYYLDKQTLMARNETLTLDGKEYDFGQSGVMRTGWIDLGGGDYRYAGKSGALVRSNWVQSGKSWYYLKDDGLMARNETLTLSGKEYAFKDSGVMRTGWISLGNGDYYYANKDGARVKGQWIKDGGKEYYLKDDGLMARSERIGDYLVNDSGAWIATWKSAYGCYDNATVYVSRNNIIHRDSGCSGMKYYSTMTLAQALRQGARRCEKCF